MKTLFVKLKTYYQEHPLFQLIVMFSSIFSIIFIGYMLSTNSKAIYTSLTSVDYKVESKATSQEKNEKKEPEPSLKVKRIDAPPRQAPVEPNNNPEEAQKQSKENVKTINEIKRKRFDSDIEQQFQFTDKF